MKEEIATFPADRGMYPFSPEMAGVSHCDGSYHIFRRQAAITVLEYIVSGTGTVEIDGRRRTVSAGQVYILRKGDRHDYSSDAADPWEKIFVNFRGEAATELFDSFSLPDQVFDGSECRDRFLFLRETAFAPLSQSEKQRKICGAYLEILMLLKKNSAEKQHHPDARICREYLDSNLSRIIGNRELADQVFRSVDSCVKLFRREYGVTPYEYHLNQKMRVARRLLRDTDLSVGEIAARVGFSDAQYFSGSFKSRCGLCPRDYRKSRREADR